MLDKKVLKWLQQTEKLLKEQFDLDTTRQEDMGRLKLNQPWEESIFGDRSMSFGRPINESTKVANLYAAMPRKNNGFEYAEQMPEGGAEQMEWLVSNQGIFHIKEDENGELSVDYHRTNMNESQLNELYENAKDGRIYVNVPGVDIMSGDARCQFLCVSGKDEPLLYDGGLKDFYDLPAEKQEHFLKNHPEIKVNKPGQAKQPGETAKNDRELLETAMLEETVLKDMENPRAVMNHVEQGLQAVSRQITMEEEPEVSEDEKILAAQKKVLSAQYEQAFWYNAHHGLPNCTREDYLLLHLKLKETLSKQVGVEGDVLSGDGLENLYVEKEDGTMEPLFPEHAQLKELGEDGMDGIYRLESAVTERLLDTLAKKPVYVYGPNQDDPQKTKAAEIRLRKNGELQTYVVTEKEPVKPAWYKRLLHSVNSNWYKDEMEQYQAEKAAQQEGLRHRENAAVARETLLNRESHQDEAARKALEKKNAEAMKVKHFEDNMAQLKKVCLSKLSQGVSKEWSMDNLSDTCSLMMFVQEMEDVAKNGTADAKEFLYGLTPEKLTNIYQNVYLKAPDVSAMVRGIKHLGAEQDCSITDYLGEGLSNAIEALGDDPKQYEKEDLRLMDVVAKHLLKEKATLAKRNDLKLTQMGKAFDQKAKAMKAEKKAAAKTEVKTEVKQGMSLT